MARLLIMFLAKKFASDFLIFAQEFSYDLSKSKNGVKLSLNFEGA